MNTAAGLRGLTAANRYLFPALALLLALYCFTAPLVTIRYQGTRFTTCTGLDLARANYAGDEAVRTFCLNSPGLKSYVEGQAADYDAPWQRLYVTLGQALNVPESNAEPKGDENPVAQQSAVPQVAPWKKAYTDLVAELKRFSEARAKGLIDSADLATDAPPASLREFVTGHPLFDGEREVPTLRKDLENFVVANPPLESRLPWQRLKDALQAFAATNQWEAWAILLVCLLGFAAGVGGSFWRKEKCIGDKVYLTAAVLACAFFGYMLAGTAQTDLWPNIHFSGWFFAALLACLAAGCSALTSVLLSLPRGNEYCVGTLRYTTFGLLYLFVLLLWADFICMLMEQELPSILPFMLKDMGASQSTIQFIIRTLGYIVTVTLAPVVGYRSDRYRGRFGRRIPYLLWSTPGVTACLLLMGFYKEIAQWLGGTFHGVGTLAMGVLVLGVIAFGFHFFNFFIGVMYNFLFNDVVPRPVMARFLSVYRIVGALASAAFSAWLFPIALDNLPLVRGIDNFKLITIVLAVLYLVVFLAVCLLVKEGKYPPPEERADKRKGFIPAAETFIKECFTHRFYRYFFALDVFLRLSWLYGPFMMFRNHESLGLTFVEIGALTAITRVVFMVLQYPAGWLADRFNPIRVHLFMTAAMLLDPIAQCIWIFADFGHTWNYYGQVIASLAFMPFDQLWSACAMPMAMRLLPRERYGQFQSASMAISRIVLIAGGTALAALLDVLITGSSVLHIPAQGDWAYRCVPLWRLFWHIPAVWINWRLYREWQKLGGDASFTPPGETVEPHAELAVSVAAAVK